jgi:dihydroxy-acid dehydratase
VVLHVTPDAASGGPLAKARSGDRIRLSVKERRLDLLVDAAELARRDAPVTTAPRRGYARLYREQILQSEHGCDFDFLRKAPLRT